MSFIDNAMELLDRTEASLHSLMTDALKAKAYGEIATIAGLAQSLAAINTGRSREGSRLAAGSSPGSAPATIGASAATAAPEPSKSAEPSWMRPKNP